MIICLLSLHQQLLLQLLVLVLLALLAQTHEGHEQGQMYQGVTEQLPAGVAVSLLVKPATQVIRINQSSIPPLYLKER